MIMQSELNHHQLTPTASRPPHELLGLPVPHEPLEGLHPAQLGRFLRELVLAGGGRGRGRRVAPGPLGVVAAVGLVVAHDGGGVTSLGEGGRKGMAVRAAAAAAVRAFREV